MASWTKHGRLGFGGGLDEVVMKDDSIFFHLGMISYFPQESRNHLDKLTQI